MLKSTLKFGFISAALLLSSVNAQAWDGVSAKSIPVFFPGQSSFEWMTSNSKHDGAARFKKGKRGCMDCHKDDEEAMGSNIVSAGAIEDAPIATRRTFTKLQVQMRQADGQLQVRLEWPVHANFGGTKQDSVDTKVTVMFDGGATPLFTTAGCWAVCHIDSTKMPADGGAEVTKYLPSSRTKMSKKKGGSDKYKPQGDIDAQMASGDFLELWQGQLNSDGSASFRDGTILKERTYNDSATISGSATLAGDKWVVEMSRPLGGGAGHHAIEAGKTYTVGFALHDDFTEGRYHQVSLHYTFALGGAAADISVQ